MKPGKDFIGFGCGALIVNDKNQVLLMHRTGKSSGGLGGTWSRPGGTVEFGETVDDAIKREIKEELNLDIELFGIGTFHEDIVIKDGEKRHWLSYGPFAKIVGGELKNTEPEKHDKIEWFDLDNLPENIVHYTKKAIEDYKEWLKK